MKDERVLSVLIVRSEFSFASSSQITSAGNRLRKKATQRRFGEAVCRRPSLSGDQKQTVQKHLLGMRQRPSPRL